MKEKRAAESVKLDYRDKKQFLVILANLGVCHFHLNQHTKADEFLKKALDAALEVYKQGLEYVAGPIYHYLGRSNTELGNFEAAISFYQKSNEMLTLRDKTSSEEFVENLSY